MWRRGKSILVALLTTVMLVGSIGCCSCAPAGGGDEELPSPPEDTGPPEGMAPPEGVPGEFSYLYVLLVIGIVTLSVGLVFLFGYLG